MLPSLRANPSSTRESYLSVAQGRGAARNTANAVLPYARMLLDPMEREYSSRYPDDTIIPTALTHFVASQTLISVSGAISLVTAQWKQWSDVNGLSYSADVTMGAALTSYGPPISQWLPLSAVDRTLACGIRARVVGLPPNTFLPPGTVYFLQLQADELSSFLFNLPVGGETSAIQAVTAGKGFSMTVNELSKGSGCTIPFLPQGPMSFVFSDTGSIPAAGSGSANSVIAPNGNIAVITFGCETGLRIRYDWAHHIEYVPTYKAAGLIPTSIMPPSTVQREAIANVVASAQKAIAGSTTSAVQNVLDPGVIAAFVGGRAIGSAASFLPLSVPHVAALRGASTVAGMAGNRMGLPPWLSSAMSGFGYAI